ncbi:MAG: Fe-S-containing hydro-lyase [Bacillota bacterium]
MKKIITTPLTDEVVERLKIGDQVYISGAIYTARDAAHKRLVELIQGGEKLPLDLNGQIIFYAGPSPTKPGAAIGSIGPTTSYRMDAYTPILLKNGLKGMIGKGSRSKEVVNAMVQYKSVYFAAIGGAAALAAQRVKKSEIIAYPELGAEAIRKLEVEDFPVTVVNDIRGGDLYQEGVKNYQG